jgi:hypothetical protein
VKDPTSNAAADYSDSKLPHAAAAAAASHLVYPL